ncbi:hypothetical protein E2562_032032 [Oryza meyeriana var. granulata]|uniref:Secreted peptide n=1 Tax=Oryza meyeriana var. granulata TaxID=110450 RepID=A0A6G1FEE2_9ORYZ|nr:hypothetical protein E2562_032032 [Oryza meyeriana var. granulata]
MPPCLSSLVLVVTVVVCPNAQLLFPVAVLPPSSPLTYCVLPLVVVVEPSEVVAVAVAREPLPLPSGSLSAAASFAPRLRRFSPVFRHRCAFAPWMPPVV